MGPGHTQGSTQGQKKQADLNHITKAYQIKPTVAGVKDTLTVHSFMTSIGNGTEVIEEKLVAESPQSPSLHSNV